MSLTECHGLLHHADFDSFFALLGVLSAAPDLLILALQSDSNVTSQLYPLVAVRSVASIHPSVNPPRFKSEQYSSLICSILSLGRSLDTFLYLLMN